MVKQWIGCAAANFQKGRPAGYRPEAVVLHVIGGTLDTAGARFGDANSGLSAHYGVGRDGAVRQFVDEADTAFHAGLAIGPTWPLLKPNVNPNFYTIGIEHEGQPDTAWSAEQVQASANLLAEIAARWNIPLDEEHVVLHSEIRPSRNCPGGGCSRPDLLNAARVAMAGVQAPPPLPPVGAIASGERSCGIPAIDNLYSGAVAAAIRPGGDPAAIGAIQDLLSGQGYRTIPGITSPAVYGTFGPKTSAAVQDFQQRCGLTVKDEVDRDTLVKLVSEPAADPRASQAYLGLALGVILERMHKVLCLVAQMEGMGRFGAINLNTDGAGLSFGIIQWAQRPRRLAELVAAFRSADQALFVQTLGGGDAAVCQGLIDHLSKPDGGVGAGGQTTDPAFNLVEDPWVSRFRQAATVPAFQTAQVDTAMTAFRKSYESIRSAAPEAATERGIAFLLDVANQFGDGGMRKLCSAARHPGITETALLEAVADDTVERMPDKFKVGVRFRRDTFLHTAFLSDGPFETAQAAVGT